MVRGKKNSEGALEVKICLPYVKAHQSERKITAIK